MKEEDNLQEFIQEEVTKIFGDNNTEDAKKYHDYLQQVSDGEIAPEETGEISETSLELLYSIAYNQCNSGNFHGALVTFHILTNFNPNDPRFVFGKGVAFHQLKDYERALDMYMFSHALSPKDPYPLFYGADCHIKLNQPFNAMVLLDMASLVTDGKDEYQELNTKINLHINQLIEEIANDMEEDVKTPEKETKEKMV